MSAEQGQQSEDNRKHDEHAPLSFDEERTLCEQIRIAAARITEIGTELREMTDRARRRSWEKRDGGRAVNRSIDQAPRQVDHGYVLKTRQRIHPKILLKLIREETVFLEELCARLAESIRRPADTRDSNSNK